MYFTWCGTEPSHSLGLHKSHHLTAPNDQVSESVVSLAQPSWRPIPSSWAYAQLHHLTEPIPVSGGGREQQEPLLIIEKQNQLTDGKKTPAFKQNHLQSCFQNCYEETLVIRITACSQFDNISKLST